MKKKWFAVLFCAVLILGLSACSSKKESEVANPMTEVTYQELVQQTGIDLPAPDGAKDVKYYTIQVSDKEIIAEMDFTLNGKAAYLRAVMTDQTTMETFTADLISGKKKLQDVDSEAFNISGLNYEWETYAVQDVQGRSAVTIRKGDVGFIAWLDAVPGVFYNLCMKAGADDQVLTDLANQVFVSMQGSVG